MALSAVRPKIEQRWMPLRRLPAGTEGLGHGGQHTIAVATTVMC
jgi:hypothetical protein